MKFRFGQLPDHHAFPFGVRPLVDWTFKVIAWFGICASLLLAAQHSGSAIIWALAIIAYLLVSLFVYSFVDWLLHVEWLGKQKKPTRRVTRAAVMIFWAAMSVLIAFGATRAVDVAVDALAHARLLRSK